MDAKAIEFAVYKISKLQISFLLEGRDWKPWQRQEIAPFMWIINWQSIVTNLAEYSIIMISYFMLPALLCRHSRRGQLSSRILLWRRCGYCNQLRILCIMVHFDYSSIKKWGNIFLIYWSEPQSHRQNILKIRDKLPNVDLTIKYFKFREYASEGFLVSDFKLYMIYCATHEDVGA